MEVYIVWKKDISNKFSSNILGIYRTKESALKKYNDYNKEQDIVLNGDVEIQSLDEELIGEFSLINNKDECYCTQANIGKNIDEIYFLKIHESLGGGRYHEICWIFMCVNIEKLIEIALDSFNAEHNRENECIDCENDKCKEKFINDLKEKYFAELDATCYEPISFQIWKVNPIPTNSN